MSDQPYEPDSTNALDVIETSPLFGRLDRAARAEIADDLSVVTVAAGQALFHQGDPGDSVYVVESGLLDVRIPDQAGGFQLLDRLDAGASVGELALLTGQPRTADVVAVVDSRLVRLSKSAFERLEARHPAIASGFAMAITPRIHRLKLSRILNRIFGNIDAETLHLLQEEVRWIRLADGEALFHKGDPGDSMYIVINGRLQMVIDPDEFENRERVLGEVGEGETVGEFALLTDDIRSTSILASRDTDVVEINRPLFEKLTRIHPQAMTEIARIIVHRQKRSLRLVASDLPGALTIAVLPAGVEGAPVEHAASQLFEDLAQFGPTALFTSARFDEAFGKPGAAYTDPDDALSLILNSWLQEQERHYENILFVGDQEWTNWTRRCLAQSDRTLLVGLAATSPAIGPVEKFCSPRSRKELVLVHQNTVEAPSDTLAWLAERDLAAHHHVRMNHPADWARLSRRLTNRAIAAVFSGGAARGLAHIGVIRAMDEVGLTVDYIGGSSMGAFIGGGWASGITTSQGMEMAARMANSRYLLDRTLPFTSLMASAKMTSMLKETFGDRRIEDLWRPFFCVSTNLTTATPVVHDRGPLWRAVRASIAMPGIFTPILNEENELLVDGGVMNNFPVDIMATRAEFGLIIGSNVSPHRDKPKAYQFGDSISGWNVLWSRMNPFAKPLRVPSLAGTILRTIEVNSLYHRKEAERIADILIEPDVTDFNFLRFEDYRAMEQRGYEAGLSALGSWQDLGA